MLGDMEGDAQYRHLVEAAPDGVVVSRNGVVLYANPAALRLLGYASASDLVGRSMAEFLSPEDMRVMRERVMAIASGTPLGPRTYAARRRDGTEVAAEITSLPIMWEGDRAVIAFARDVTERARLEAQLARNERLASLGTLSAGLAHEVNNPLAFASLGLERLQRLVAKLDSHPIRTELEEVIADVRGGTDRVAAIVRDLRAFGREELIGPARAELGPVLDGVRRLVAHVVSARATLDLRVGDLPAVRGQPHRLEQVFTNLVVNAAHSFAEHAPENRITITGETRADRRIVVTVEDNGAGMTPEVLARAFDPFFTTKPGTGSGLGLWISHSIVSEVGGELTLASRPGGGTRAVVVLDRADDAEAAARALPESTKPKRRVSVFVVDDEPAIVRAVHALLTPEHEVLFATSGDEALARLLSGPEPDVVLCDLSMPGVTGADVYARLAAGRPGLERRIVFMTGGAFTDAARAFLDRVPNRRLEKPFTLAAIEFALRESLDGAGPAPSE
jgi:two-component system, cell cycle sensor histidine kinase and response regulator CckA